MKSHSPFPCAPLPHRRVTGLEFRARIWLARERCRALRLSRQHGVAGKLQTAPKAAWSALELADLKYGATEIAKLLGRPQVEVEKKAVELGLKIALK